MPIVLELIDMAVPRMVASTGLNFAANITPGLDEQFLVGLGAACKVQYDALNQEHQFGQALEETSAHDAVWVHDQAGNARGGCFTSLDLLDSFQNTHRNPKECNRDEQAGLMG